ncbi:hypothetical protein ACSFA8_12750 [Variovorax sp. RT4R15]|uniref:hypothetical protein n=1 Tax=Variovorax sp. RT4R15 TaxID=3443737 RepID=UPI003F463199
MRKFFKWLIWFVLAFLVAAVLAVVVVRVIYQYAWTATGNSSCVIYAFTPSFDSFESIQLAAAVITRRHALEELEPRLDTVLYKQWGPARRLLGNSRPQIAVTLEAYPRDQTDARKMDGHMSVCTVEADKTEEWKTLAQELEKTLSPLVQFKDARAQLDPRVFGFCASKERPQRLDTVCSIQLNVPVDFDRLSSDILYPRAVEAAQQK